MGMEVASPPWVTSSTMFHAPEAADGRPMNAEGGAEKSDGE